MSADAKRKILARRAQFVAAALAGLSADGCHKEHAEKPDAGVQQPPMPCLSVPMPTETTPPVQTAQLPPIPLDAGPPPRPCLAPVLDTATPHPCLKPPPPRTRPRPGDDKEDEVGF
jgi:hypothetical protein